MLKENKLNNTEHSPFMTCMLESVEDDKIKIYHLTDRFIEQFGHIDDLEQIVCEPSLDNFSTFVKSIKSGNEITYIGDVKLLNNDVEKFEIYYNGKEHGVESLFFKKYISNYNNDLQKSKIEALGSLAGGIAHDFNNILSIVEGYTNLILEKEKKGEVSFDDTSSIYFEKIIQAAKRGGSLTRQLLAFSRQKIMLEQFENISDTIIEQIDFLKPLLGALVVVDSRIDYQNCIVKTSPDVVNQIIMNLLVNARDAMPTGGTATVELSKADKLPKKFKSKSDTNLSQSYALLKITDTGTGMPDKVKDKIFDPFFTTKDQGKGTGLGLSTVHGLISQLGGYIDVQSELGKGTTFLIYLPAVENTAADLDTEEEISTDCLKGKTILIVEDEDDLREILVSLFQKEGMEVISASNGNEALMVQDDFDNPLDFVLTDIVMPEMHGGLLGEMLGALRPEANIMYMSGYAGRSTIDQNEIPEESLIFNKPLESKKVFEVMKKILKGEEHGEIVKIVNNHGA